jgi:hypothetical protein
MDAYRAGVGSDSKVETDIEKFKEAAAEVAELVDVIRNLGPRAQEEGTGEGSNKGSWKFQTRSIVRTFMGRTKSSFEEEPEWVGLKELLHELKND